MSRTFSTNVEYCLGHGSEDLGQNARRALACQRLVPPPVPDAPVTPGFEGIVSTDGKWKLHLRHAYNALAVSGKDGMPGKYESRILEASLFDMEKDPYETTNVMEKYPEAAARLQAYAAEHRRQFYGER